MSYYGSRSPKYIDLGHFTLLLCRGRQRNVPRFKTHVHKHCRRSRHRRRRGLLKLPIKRPGGGGGVSTKFNTGEAPPRGPTLTLLYTILAEKVPLSLIYPFYIPFIEKKVPLFTYLSVTPSYE